MRISPAQGPYALRGARVATATVPIVGIDNESDPIAAGYATSLARPGGNVTGVFLDQSEVSAKQLQLLTEMVPGLTRVAVLWDDAVATAQRKAVDDGAGRLGVTVAPIAWRGPDALPGALRSATQDGARGLIVLSTTRILNSKDRPLVAAAALKSRLPAIGLTSTFARDGLLIANGPRATRHVPQRSDHGRQDPRWRPAGRSSDRATGPLRVGDQRQDREGARLDDPAIALAARG